MQLNYSWTDSIIILDLINRTAISSPPLTLHFPNQKIEPGTELHINAFPINFS